MLGAGDASEAAVEAPAAAAAEAADAGSVTAEVPVPGAEAARGEMTVLRKLIGEMAAERGEQGSTDERRDVRAGDRG